MYANYILQPSENLPECNVFSLNDDERWPLGNTMLVEFLFEVFTEVMSRKAANIFEVCSDDRSCFSVSTSNFKM